MTCYLFESIPKYSDSYVLVSKVHSVLIIRLVKINLCYMLVLG